MLYQVDTRKDVILLISKDFQVVDAFESEGKTKHECSEPVAYYTYRTFVTQPGTCVLCLKGLDAINEMCVSSGGFHAIPGIKDRGDIPDGHKAEFRSVPLVTITFDELSMYLENDNLFPIEEISKPMVV